MAKGPTKMNNDENHNSRPIPDPTYLTTQQLIREQAGLKELVLSVVEGNFKVIDTRLTGTDRALELLATQQGERQSNIDSSVAQLRALHDEKFTSLQTISTEIDKRLEQRFTSIDTQFAERDKRTEQLSLADKTAIAAALQAQKEAAGATNEANGAALAKMEANFTKLIEQGSALVASVSKNLDDKIADLKSRMDRGEGKTSIADPAISAQLQILTAQMASLSASRDTHAGSEKQVADGTARMWSIIAIVVAAAVGLGEIVVHLH